jgi:peptide subunit release factor 1 (eRF1)
MKIKVNSEYNEISIECIKKKGIIKIVYRDSETNEIISEQIVDNLIIGEEYDIDLDIPNNYELKKEEEKKEPYENQVLAEMMKLRDAMRNE